MLRRLLFFAVSLLSTLTAWAGDVTYAPTLDVNFRSAAGNTSWQAVNNAADDGKTEFELTYAAGFFALQKYTVADLQNASKLVLTLTVGSKSGVDAVKLWAFTNNSWTADTGVDDLVPLVKAQTGIELRATEGTMNTPLVTGAKVTGSNPAKATFTITGTALATIKANATSDGTFTLLLTNDNLTNANNKRSYLSVNEANAEANRPTLVATIETPSVVNKTTGVGYSTLTEAFNAAVTADADAELEVYEDQTLTSRLTWNKAHTLTITPKADITIKGHRNGMWFLVNVNNAVLNIGGSDHTITMDGQGNTFEYDVTKYENSATIALTNVTFQNFDLNGKGHLVGSKPQEGKIILDRVTIKDCSNPLYGFICKTRVTNDRVELKGYLNQEGSTGTTIYAASETKSSGTTGRIKINDAAFTANSPITIFWGINNGYDGANNTTNVPTAGTMQAGIIVVIGTSATNAGRFQLTEENWTLERKSNGDLVMAVPATPTAKIGDVTYADLTAALAAVNDGETATITLLDDQEISSRINIKNKVITITGGKTIKRATSYTNGLMFLTVTADEGMHSDLTLDGVNIDGQSVETSAAVFEASNYGTTTLKDVTIKNVNTTASAVIINKSNGFLVLDGVTFTGCTTAKGEVFVGTDNVTLKGNNTIATIYIEKSLAMKAESATATAPIQLVTETSRVYGMLVEGGDATQFTCTGFRLSQQMDGIYAMPLAVAASYEHPALLHTSADITRVKGLLTTEPYASAYSRLETQSAGTPAGAVEYLKRMDQANWQDTYSDYNNFTKAATDAKLAYELALRYQLKGNEACATQAVNILNNWATTNKGFLRLKGYNNNIPDPNEYLMTIQAYQFANAAELLRGYTGWQAADFAKFQNWMRQTFADVAILFLQNHHNNENSLHYWLNWDLAALSAMMSVGILCDDQALVNYALDYVNNGTGTGTAANATVATHDDPDSDETLAQCQESGRDQGHATLDVTLLGVLCQTAQHVGTDLFTPYKALEMAEYVGKYNLMDASNAFVYSTVPFTAYNYNEGTHTAISADARGTVRPCWELFFAYANANSKSAIYTQKWVQYMRAKNTWGEAESETTDELGFGTLMFGVDNDIVTAIDAIESITPATDSDAVYDLSGRRVVNPVKGIYIINGKKVVIK